MAKLTLADLTSLTNETSAIAVLNANWLLIETAMENTLSRDGTSPNTLSANLDANTHKVVNLQYPTANTDAASKLYVDTTLASVSSIAADALVAINAANAAAATATAATTTANNAATAAGTAVIGTSTTSLTPSIASKVFTTQAAKQWAIGTRLRAASASVPTVFMEGVVTAYTGTSLTINVDSIGTATTKADWNISIAGQVGLTGAAGGTVTTPGTTVVDNIVSWNSTTGLALKDTGLNINSFVRDPAGNGIAVRTAAGTAAARSIAVPAAGISITNADGTAGNPTLALANDLSALEALSSTGFAARTATDTWAQRTLQGGNGVVITNPAGTAGDPSIAVDKATSANIYAKTSNKVLTADNLYAAGAAVSVAFTASLTLDFATGFNFDIGALTGNLTLNTPTNLVQGQSGTIYLVQDGTGSRTVTLSANFEGATFTMPTAASTRAALNYKVDKNGTKVMYTAFTTGLS